MVESNSGDEVIKSPQNEAITWKNRGNGLAKQGNYEGALSFYNTGLRLDPNNTDIWHNKSAVLTKLGRVDDAQICKQKIKEINEMSPGDKVELLLRNESPLTPSLSPTYNRNYYPTKCKSPIIIAMLSFFFPGSGQVDNGQLNKGISLLIGSLVGLGLFVIPGVIIIIYSICDSYTTAKKMNLGIIPCKKAGKWDSTVYIIVLLIMFMVWLGIMSYARLASPYFTSHTN